MRERAARGILDRMYFLVKVHRRDPLVPDGPGITTVVPVDAASWEAACAQLREEFPATEGWTVDPPMDDRDAGGPSLTP